MMRFSRWLCLGLSLCLGYTSLQAAQLIAIAVKDKPDSTKVLFQVSGPFAYKLFTLPNPNRLVVDFAETGLKMDAGRLAKGHGLIRNIRVGYPKVGDRSLRVVFDLKRAVKIQQNPSARQLELELLSTTAEQPKARGISAVPARVKASLKQLVHHESRRRPHKGQIVVVIDPGHGGKDPGAAGPRKAQEKTVTLAIAKSLKRLIDKEPGMRAVLTRDGDYYVGLRQRLNIARKQNADIFMSIHADAFINKNSSGASVFALSQNGATSEAARWLAEKENYSELGGVDLAGLGDQSGLVRSVLIDLSQTATINASLAMGNHILRALDTITKLHNRKVEQARFVVLKSPDIPSVLVETGFISNPREEANLTSPQYQTRLTQSLLGGLKRYFRYHPGG